MDYSSVICCISFFGVSKFAHDRSHAESRYRSFDPKVATRIHVFDTLYMCRYNQIHMAGYSRHIPKSCAIYIIYIYNYIHRVGDRERERQRERERVSERHTIAYSIYMFIYIYTHTAYMCIYTYNIYIYMYTYKYKYKYIYMYIYVVYVCMYVM